MMAKDNMLLNTPDKEGFQFFMKTVAPHYKLGGRKMFTKLIDQKYEVLSDAFKSKLEKVSNFVLTTNVWTDTLNTKSFLGITF